jgi:hypothetical protein
VKGCARPSSGGSGFVAAAAYRLRGRTRSVEGLSEAQASRACSRKVSRNNSFPAVGCHSARVATPSNPRAICGPKSSATTAPPAAARLISCAGVIVIRSLAATMAT